MKKIALLAIAGFSLSACVVAIGDDDWDDNYRYSHGGGKVTVTTDDGDVHRFSCPAGFESFYDEDDDGKVTYGCEEKSRHRDRDHDRDHDPDGDRGGDH